MEFCGAQKARQELAEEIEFQCFLQYQFERQWTALKSYANGRISIIGDIPIYVPADSAENWAYPSSSSCMRTAPARCRRMPAGRIFNDRPALGNSTTGSTTGIPAMPGGSAGCAMQQPV